MRGQLLAIVTPKIGWFPLISFDNPIFFCHTRMPHIQHLGAIHVIDTSVIPKFKRCIYELLMLSPSPVLWLGSFFMPM